MDGGYFFTGRIGDDVRQYMVPPFHLKNHFGFVGRNLAQFLKLKSAKRCIYLIKWGVGMECTETFFTNG